MSLLCQICQVLELYKLVGISLTKKQKDYFHPSRFGIPNSWRVINFESQSIRWRTFDVFFPIKEVLTQSNKDYCIHD